MENRYAVVNDVNFGLSKDILYKYFNEKSKFKIVGNIKFLKNDLFSTTVQDNRKNNIEVLIKNIDKFTNDISKIPVLVQQLTREVQIIKQKNINGQGPYIYDNFVLVIDNSTGKYFVRQYIVIANDNTNNNYENRKNFLEKQSLEKNLKKMEEKQRMDISDEESSDDQYSDEDDLGDIEYGDYYSR